MTTIVLGTARSGKSLEEASPTHIHLLLRTLVNLLGGFNYRYGSEVQLHATLAQVLLEAGIRHVREFHLDEDNRADFWLPLEQGGLVIEVKVDGGIGDALRQVSRYAALPSVQGVLLASTCRWARPELSDVPATGGWGGKPAAIVHLKRQAL
jgi:hypothetical protein